MAEILDQSKDREKNLLKDMTQTEEKSAIGALESALAAVEEDQDVQAAKTAKAEAVADLAEFDENIPVDDADNEELVSKAEQDLQNIVSQVGYHLIIHQCQKYLFRSFSPPTTHL